MTNVPFINKITNELSKRKLKSDVVANAILDIAVGNDRLDNLIANGVTHSDLESLTIGGLTTEQTAAIEKIEGLEASASEIDNMVTNGATQADLRALALSTGNLTESQVATLDNLNGLQSSASEIDSVIGQFSEIKQVTRIRLDAGISNGGFNYSYPSGDVQIYSVKEGEVYKIKGHSFGGLRRLYAFYPLDSADKPIELGDIMTNTLTEYKKEIIVPVGAKFLYLSKVDGYEISLYKDINLYEKEDKVNTLAIKELAYKASLGSKYVDSGLLPITFSDGKKIYLWEIIKSIKLTFPKNFNFYTTKGVLRDFRINTIHKATDAYISFEIKNKDGNNSNFNGTLYHIPFGSDEKNISGTLTFLLDGYEIIADVLYDFSVITNGTYSTNTNSWTSGNNIISSNVFTDHIAKTESAVATDYSTINAFNILEKAPGMIKFGSSDIARTRHASCVFGDMHEDWTPLYNLSKIYDYCPDFKSYVFATIGVGDFLSGTRTREANITVLDGLKKAIASHNIPFGACLGGHDFGNDQTGLLNRNRVTHCLTKQDQRENIIIPSLNTFGVNGVIGTGKSDACYWYANDINRKVRYIFLDECDLPNTLATDTNFYKYDRYADLMYSQEQLTWLVDTALDVASDWNIVICTHTAISYRGGAHDIGGTVGAMWNCLKSYNNKTTANITLNGEIPIIINKNFSSSNGKIICVLWGHTHASANHVLDGINIINVPNSGSFASNAGYSLNNAQDRDCAEFLIADTVSKDLRFLRYGRRGVNVISGDVPLEIKPNNTGDRFVDSPLVF